MRGGDRYRGLSGRQRAVHFLFHTRLGNRAGSREAMGNYNAMIDTTFKMYRDTPANEDPDSYSPTLRDYHIFLWSKPLPGGKVFRLTAGQTAPYRLYHNSDVGDFDLSSDRITSTYSGWKRMAISGIINSISKVDIDNFYNIGSTIGGYIIFPANRIERRPTINGIRGMHRRINDRFDLTLECIRRYYDGVESPLFTHLERYRSFFCCSIVFKVM